MRRPRSVGRGSVTQNGRDCGCAASCLYVMTTRSGCGCSPCVSQNLKVDIRHSSRQDRDFALHRRLARDGWTFSSIVDAVRVDLARRYVEGEGRSLSEISDLLEFSTLSGFSRWFRTKFGCSPISWRMAELARSEALYPEPSQNREPTLG
jgi:AraC-like DNA-binding protein